MKKELKDYLHLYLGCEVETFTRDNVMTLSPEILYEYLTMGCYSEIKPILRPLSDITEEEAFWIAKEILFSNYHAFQYRSLKEEDRIIIYGKSCYEDGDLVSILFDGQMTKRIDNCTVDVPFEEGYSVIPFLLSKHFDIFGLIEAGLAVNASTLMKL